MGFLDILNDVFNNMVVNQQGVNNSPLSNQIIQGPMVQSSNAQTAEEFLSRIKLVPTPNKNERKEKVKSIVLHHTGPGTMEGTISWLTSTQAKASAHYIIDTNGDIVCLGSPDDRLWHVGVSYWNFDGNECHDVNDVAIGIELLNPGRLIKHTDGKIYLDEGQNSKEFQGEVFQGSITYPDGHIVSGPYTPYPQAQIDSCVRLCKALIEKYPAILPQNMLRHLDVAVPSGRKDDPFGLDFEAFKQKVFGNNIS